MEKRSNKAQVTIFVIIAILIVAGVSLYLFVFREPVDSQFRIEVQPIENTFLNCLEDELYLGIDLLESQGGSIDQPEFEPGSEYMPFSSHLDFAGTAIPYWYYVSGNNIPKEQVPSLDLMENELENFIEERAGECYMEEYYGQGYSIDMKEPEADVSIRDNQVELNLEMDMVVGFGNNSVVIEEHNKIVNSNLGSLYGSAKEIYDHEQETFFLEERGIDILGLYAPVNGVEVTCSPMTWNADEVFNNLSEAIEVNTLALKNQGDKDDYFLTELPVSEDHKVEFINSRNWPKTFEVAPSDENFMIANPIGNQPGMGILGFCYVNYHFVYDIKYPVLVQVSDPDTEEVFRFPIAVIIEGNRPREPLEGEAIASQSIGICENKNNEMSVSVLDMEGNPVEAKISYECFGERCDIGTVVGNITANFPQCVNGFIVVQAEGYEDKRVMYSSVDGGSASIYLEKEYEIPVELQVDNSIYNKEAVISFITEEGAETIIYPEQKKIKLSEGFYEVDISIYENVSIELEEATTERCVEQSIGFFGLTRTKCYDVELPENIVTRALAGGGKQEYYILDSQLDDSEKIKLKVDKFPEVNNLEQLQENYLLFEGSGVDLEF